MNVRLIDCPPLRMGYLRYQGAYGPALGRFWAQTFTPWLATQNLGPVSRFGIGHDDPSLTPAEQCRYDAGVAVPDDWVPNSGALVTELPGGRYAVLDFEGTAADIGAAWAGHDGAAGCRQQRPAARRAALLRTLWAGVNLRLSAPVCSIASCASRWRRCDGRFVAGLSIPQHMPRTVETHP